jgi:hypothetical protein
LFDKLEKSILRYGCECLGYGNNSIFEKVQLKYLKHIYGLKSSTPNCIVYVECGVKPFSIDIDCTIINFWSDLVVPKELKLSSPFYQIAFKTYKTSRNVNRQTFLCFKHIKNILVK